MDHRFLLGITLVSFSSTRAHTENEERKFRNFHGYLLIWMWNHKLLLRIQDSSGPGYSIALPTLPPPPQASENSAVNCRTFQPEFQQHLCRFFFFFSLKVVSDSLENVKRFVNMKRSETFPKLFSPSGLGSSVNCRRRHIPFTICNICSLIVQCYIIAGKFTSCKNVS
jgi:hypothetical protein